MLNLKIKKDKFIEWYFEFGSDQSNLVSQIMLSNNIIKQLKKKGAASISVQELFDNANKDYINSKFVEELDDVGDVELCELDDDYNLKLID